MKRFLPLLLLLGAFACSTVRQLPSTDSTKVEVRTETVTVHDTAYVELPVIIEKVATLDTKVETKIVYKDSLVYRDRVQTQTVEVEKKLTAWQQAKMKLGSVALLLIGLAIIYLIYLIVKRF